MRPHPYLDPLPLRGRISRPQPKGLPIINLGFNELPFDPPDTVLQAIKKRGAQGQSYGSPHVDDLRDALGARHGLNPEHIVCGNGSEELLDLITRCFARPGDAVLISQFGYVQFQLATNRVGATLLKAPETNFTTDIDALLGAVTERTKVLFLANPNNPTGTMVPLDDLRRLADGLPGHVVLVLDLAYGEFATPGYCAAVDDLVTGRDNVVVTRTFSKAYGLAGLRVGWCHAPDWMVPVLYAARGMGTVNGVAQAAALAALDEQALITDRVAQIVGERERLSGSLRQLGLEVTPSHANFLMVRMQGASPQQTEALVEHLFDDGGFVVNRTREAGLETFLRFSMGLPDQNDALIASLHVFVEQQTHTPSA